MSALEHGHQHGEAFMLMTYASDDRQTVEFVWNSRDGVTPFVITARDGVTQMTHVNWHADRYQPYRIPDVGERIFVDLTPERAAEGAQRNAERFWNDPTYPASQDDRYADVDDLARQLTASYLEQPGSPDLVEVDEQIRSTFLPKLPTEGDADDDTTDQGRPGGETAADTRAGADSREVGAVVSEAAPVSEEGAPGERSARRPPSPAETAAMDQAAAEAQRAVAKLGGTIVDSRDALLTVAVDRDGFARVTATTPDLRWIADSLALLAETAAKRAQEAGQ